MELTNQDWYQSLVDDCKATLTEGVYNSRWTLIETYHSLGKRILENYDKFNLPEKEIRSRVTKDLGQTDRTIRRAIQFARKYPKLDALPEGKNISWHKICNKYLPEPKKEPKVVYITCPKCNHKWEK